MSIRSSRKYMCINCDAINSADRRTETLMGRVIFVRLCAICLNKLNTHKELLIKKMLLSIREGEFGPEIIMFEELYERKRLLL